MTTVTDAGSTSEWGDDVFAEARPRLLGLAYRMTGGRFDAEDVVQEAWMRWHAADRASIERPEAWLTTVTTRLAIDRLRARERRKEDYVGPWLPEPIVSESGPEDAAELSDSLTLGFLVVLDELSPVERAVFLLAEVFGMPFTDVAETVGKSEAACRQIASRARRRLHPEEHRRPTADERRLVDELIAALAGGDVRGVLSRLAPDAVLTSDGGPAKRAARYPVVGSERVARFMLNITRRYFEVASRVVPTTINGDPGLLVYIRDRIDVAIVFGIGDGRVNRIWSVLNAEKLARLDVPMQLA